MTQRRPKQARRPQRSEGSREPRAPEAFGEEVLIDRLAAGGRGVGRAQDGRVVFVPGGLPGDRWLVKTARLKKRLAEGVDVELQSPSSERVTPVCSDQKECGGCDLMPLPIEAQRKAKLTIVQGALSRVAGLPDSLLPQEVEGSAPLAYRSRVRLQVQGAKLGFFAPGSHELVEIQHCHVCRDELWQDALILRQALSEIDAECGLEYAELRHLPGAERGSVFLKQVSPSKGKAAQQSLQQLAASLESRLLVRVDWAPPVRESLEVGGVQMQLAVGGFVQVHDEVNQSLVDRVLRIAKAAGSKNFLDVYCGSGNFALPLLARGLRGVGVELADEAIESARLVAEEQGFDARFVARRAEDELDALTKSGKTFDLVVVDPPRAGAPRLAGRLAQVCRGDLLMVSCDPVTLARDLGELTQNGFELLSVEALDMFPQTHHVESFAHLRRV